MEARVITLEPNQEVDAVSFEEAFGGHSELRGRGRARRHKRKMERIKNRGEEQEGRQANRQGKKNRRVQGKMGRKAMKGQANRDEQMADAETDQSVEAMQPQEDQGYSTPSDDSNEQSGGSYEQESAEAPEELTQESDESGDESSFDAETSGEQSSFDAETSEAAGNGKSRADKIEFHKRGIEVFGKKIADLRAAMQSGKLPSDKVARSAKMLREFSDKLKRSKERLAQLESSREEHSNRGLHKGQRREKTTPVQASLHADLAPQKIVVPASSFDGDDMSSFDAKDTFSKYKPYILGVAVAGIAIFALHKMNVFKK